MTIAEVRDRLLLIYALRSDDEAAHGAEDALRRDVLRAIADGADDAPILAGLALESDRYEFTRWCS